MFRPDRLAYQPTTSSPFLSEQTSHHHFSFRTNQQQSVTDPGKILGGAEL
jgi:hypothetical protein